MLIKIKYAVLLLLALLHILPAMANTITVQDLADRQVEIQLPVNRVFLLDSRDIVALDIVAGKAGLQKLAGWSGSLAYFAPDMQEQYFKKYPQLATLPTFGKTGADIQTEEIINIKPELVIATMWSYPKLMQNDAINQLIRSGVNIVFIDFKYNTPANALKSITLLGKIFGTQQRAREFNQFYTERLNTIQQKLAAAHHRPSILLEKHAGVSGLDDCCLYYGTKGLGHLAKIAGGHNLAETLLPAAGGKLTVESLLSLQPDYYIMTGANWTHYRNDTSSISLGYQADKTQVNRQLARLLNRQGINILTATEKGKVVTVYNHFYDNPFSIIVIEVLAKTFYPELFPQLQPLRDLQKLHEKFMSIPATGIFWLLSQNNLN